MDLAEADELVGAPQLPDAKAGQGADGAGEEGSAAGRTSGKKAAKTINDIEAEPEEKKTLVKRFGKK